MHCSRYPKASDLESRGKLFSDQTKKLKTIRLSDAQSRDLALDQVLNLAVSCEVLLKQMKKSLAPHGLIMVPKGSNRIC